VVLLLTPCLSMAQGSSEPDCLDRSRRAWQLILKSDGDQAEALLNVDGCPDPGPERARWFMLRAALADLRGDRAGTSEFVGKALQEEVLFAGDRAILTELGRRGFPRWLDSLQLRLEVGGGYSSDAVTSGPEDPGTAAGAGATGSPLILFDAFARFRPRLHALVNPQLDLAIRGLFLTDGTPSPATGLGPDDHSRLRITARPGIALGASLRAHYRAELLLLTGGDPATPDAPQASPGDSGPRWLHERHRGEVELEPMEWLALFGGAGVVRSRHGIRSRTEADGGIGLQGKLWRLHLAGGFAMRGHWGGEGQVEVTLPGGSVRDVLISPYDLYGGTLLASAILPLPYVTLRARFSFAFDSHLRSEGYFDDQTLHPDDDPTRSREDQLVRAGLQVWSMAWRGLRGGVGYTVSHRASNKGVYGFTDHRVVARLRYRFSMNPLGPSKHSAPADQVALPHTARPHDELTDERIQDLMWREVLRRR